MKKFLVFLAYIAVGFALLEVSSIGLATIDKSISTPIDFILFWSSFVIGIWQFIKFRKLEMEELLKTSGFYEPQQIGEMSNKELTQRFKLQKKYPQENFSVMSFDEVNQRTFEELKKSAIQGAKATASGIKGSVESVKAGISAARDLKDNFVEGYNSGEKMIAGNLSNTTPKISSVSKSKNQSKSHDHLDSFYYKSVIRDIKNIEDEIAKKKDGIDSAQRSMNKYLEGSPDAHLLRVAEGFRDDKNRLEKEVRDLEKQLYELIKVKRQEEDKASRS